MTATAWTRAIATTLAVALVPAAAPDLFGLPCPHHAGHAPGTVESPAGVQERAGHGRHGTPGESPSAPCTCLGECPVSAAPEAPRAELSTLLAEPTTYVLTATPRVATIPRATRTRLQPPATAPPLS